ncbi:DNA helicase-2/ATP-dependent DNA helicase PcrA [Haloferula luteola]|uniref:DNA 3'-5' helicase n=1 Tax=Haloferula luteola TaxID=595692 RepID=A0A840VGP6_9BACT|nr:ATP-dependent helicase [Haloferula luteola]MBB5353768.1 DNA helicase-2/ATP-dependent DNA helicase PcrA [Haloferula luteola]
MARDYTLHRKPTGPASGIDYRAELNDEQFGAVTSSPGRALVIAGAGSGKTRTLTYRVAYLLDQGIDARHILLLTFTNKAAREMTERVRSLVPHDVSALWSGTFHSIGNRILRRHAEELGFTKSFSILDTDDQKSLLASVVGSMAIDTKVRRFPKADVLVSMFSLERNTGEALKDILAVRYPYFDSWQREIHEVRDAYARRKQETNSMDFDDLLLKTLELFRDHPDILALYQQRFRHLLVDEYQDTNSVQSELIDLLAAGGSSVMAVGDDAQSIYSWRGADMGNILSFPKRHDGCRVFKIETNYRSVPEILELSNAAIRANRSRFEKDLRSSREVLGVKPALVPLEDPSAQAQFVAQRILELRDEGVPLEEMAVLYRAHFQSLEIQMELTSRGIPFAITSGLRFFEQAHIKDVAAFLRLVTNRRDEMSFKRILQLMPGIGNKGAEKLWSEWRKSGAATAEEAPDWPAALALKGVPKKAAKMWEQLGYILAEMTPGGSFARPGDMIYSVLEGMYDDHLKASYDNYENRRSDIEQLMAYASQFEDILEFLSQLSLLGGADGEPGGKREEQDTEKITLSSIHQAKGLEWKAVFLVWLADGAFPNGRIIEADDEAMMEEERRLFYVALTRAKDELYLSYPLINPKSYSGEVIQRPSRFLDDFPKEMVEEWNVSPRWGDSWEVDEPF